MKISTVFKSATSNILAPPSYAPKLRCSVRFLYGCVFICLAASLVLEASFMPMRRHSSPMEQQASHDMLQAMAVIREYREKRSVAIDPVLDPNLTGVIGLEYSDLTTTEGVLTAKRTATNPAFAALVVRLLHEAGVERGDRIAVSFSGSFPALNIAVLAAAKSMSLSPVIISSVGASTYGANIPGLTWPDMETLLYEAGLFPYCSIALSLGGLVETGGGLEGTGIKLAEEAIARHGAAFLAEGDYRSVAKDALNRKGLFDKNAPIKAFINVGGSLTSLGWVAEAAYLDNGLLRHVPATKSEQRGLIFQYVEEGIPVIHLLNVVRLAERYALPIDPIPLPEPGSLTEDRFLFRYLGVVVILLVWCLGGLWLLHRDLMRSGYARPEP